MARHVIGPVDMVPAGERLLVTIGGREIGIFNISGSFYALRNSCRHHQAPVCLGEVGGTYLPSAPDEYLWGLADRVLRCPWHGWEYDITTGCNLIEPALKLKTYPVIVENGQIIVEMGVRPNN